MSVGFTVSGLRSVAALQSVETQQEEQLKSPLDFNYSLPCILVKRYTSPECARWRSVPEIAMDNADGPALRTPHYFSVALWDWDSVLADSRRNFYVRLSAPS